MPLQVHGPLEEGQAPPPPGGRSPSSLTSWITSKRYVSELGLPTARTDPVCRPACGGRSAVRFGFPSSVRGNSRSGQIQPLERKRRESKDDRKGEGAHSISKQRPTRLRKPAVVRSCPHSPRYDLTTKPAGAGATLSVKSPRGKCLTAPYASRDVCYRVVPRNSLTGGKASAGTRSRMYARWRQHSSPRPDPRWTPVRVCGERTQGGKFSVLD